MRIVIAVSALFVSVAVIANTSQTTTVIEQHNQSQQGEVDTTTVQTQMVAPSTNEMPAWKQALQHDTTTTTITQNINVEDDHTEITSVQKQVIAPDTSEMPAWKQALQPPATTTITTQEKEITDADGDEITTVETEKVGPVPAWDQVPQVSQ